MIKPYYNHLDHLGSISAVSSKKGQMVESVNYYPYGGSRVSSGSYNSQRKYIGEIYDSISELNYLNARYYNSKQGQFISMDPMFWNFDQTWLLDPQNQNSYSYAKNNPVNLSDPSGNCPQCIAFAGAVVVGGLIGGTISAANGGSFWDGAKYGAIAGGTTAIVVMTAGMAAPALGLTSAQAIVGGSAVGNALGGTLARTAAGENTTIADVGIDTVLGAAGGMLGVGYLKYKGNMGANGNYIPSMSTKNLPQDAKTLLSEYKSNGWQKASSGTTGNPHPWRNNLPKGALPYKGTVFDAQYSQGTYRGVERFVKVRDHVYYSNTHYGENPQGSIPFYKLTK